MTDQGAPTAVAPAGVRQCRTRRRVQTRRRSAPDATDTPALSQSARRPGARPHPLPGSGIYGGEAAWRYPCAYVASTTPAFDDWAAEGRQWPRIGENRTTRARFEACRFESIADSPRRGRISAGRRHSSRTARSPFWIRRENVILRRHLGMAREPALGTAWRQFGRLERVGRRVISPLGICPSVRARDSLVILFDE